MKKPVELSEINIIPVKPQDGLVAFASFVLDKKFYMGSIAVFTTLDGSARLVYPKKNNMHCFHPINKKVGEYITKIIQENFNNLLTKNNHDERINACRKTPERRP